MKLALTTAIAIALVWSCSSDDGDDDDDAADAAVACAEQSTCELCLTCAASGPCDALSVACQQDADCRAFYQCIGEGDDPDVIAQCRSEHGGGAERFCADTECTVYEQCGSLCEPSQVCPPP